MTTARIFLIALGLTLATLPARAGTLYDDLGGQPGIQKFVDRTIDLAFTDPRIKDTFKHSKPAHLKSTITEQFCALTGGPQKYTGLDMKKAHKGLGLTTYDFNALVEVLQQAMDESHIPYRTQNRLITMLAPMHRDVVEGKKPADQAPAVAKP